MTATGHHPARVRSGPRARLSIVGLALCAVLWLVSLVRIDVDAIGSLGLLSAFPITMFVALGVLTLSMARATHRREASAVLAAHVVLFLVIVHGTPAVLYETLRYAWAWKHLGLVDSLARHHVVDPHVKNLNAYQSWPGFFAAAAAWLAGSGATSWTGAAQWAPLFFELLDALALYAVLDALDADRRVVWTGVWLFALGNWIGQDYFSPQAFAFFLYLVVILVVVRRLGRRPPSPRALARLARIPRIAPEDAPDDARDDARDDAPDDAPVRVRRSAETLAAAGVVLHRSSSFARRCSSRSPARSGCARCRLRSSRSLRCGRPPARSATCAPASRRSCAVSARWAEPSTRACRRPRMRTRVSISSRRSVAARSP